jgi:hypothetical protein
VVQNVTKSDLLWAEAEEPPSPVVLLGIPSPLLLDEAHATFPPLSEAKAGTATRTLTRTPPTFAEPVRVAGVARPGKSSTGHWGPFRPKGREFAEGGIAPPRIGGSNG